MMKREGEYFVLEDQEGNPIPRIVQWQGKVDLPKLYREGYQSLPRMLTLDAETGMDFFYPDFLFCPVLMVSREAMEVICLYEEGMDFRFCALFDRRREEGNAYYFPVLPEEEGHVLYRKRKGNGFEYRIRLDLAESLLRREASGFVLKEGE